MKRILGTSLLFAVLALQHVAAAPGPSIAKICDDGISQVEREVVGLAEAMPADKYSFAPTNGEFKGARTFGEQMSHIATVNYMVSSRVLGEKNPVDAGKNGNGPDSYKTKEAIVKFLKDSFVYARKAAHSLTADNYTEEVTTSPGHTATRATLIAEPVWHSFDHYGQAVVYARMNGIVPPASRR
ncbi:MAG TPA: DinB family protein [Bryobacteraceae bacterium]|nr:DinB family protein [Bryobacteraceae bacterium]